MKRIQNNWYKFTEEEFLEKLGLNHDGVLVIKDIDRFYVAKDGGSSIQICLLEEVDDA